MSTAPTRRTRHRLAGVLAAIAALVAAFAVLPLPSTQSVATRRLAAGRSVVGTRVHSATLAASSSLAMPPARGQAPHTPGAPMAPAGWTATTSTLLAGGRERSYLLIRPPAQPGVQLPVVIVLHGRLMTPASIDRVSGLLPALGPSIAVLPAGVGQSWDAGACCGVAHAQRVDDLGFLTALVRHVLASEPDAAPGRTYLVGYSNGGRMAMRLACTEPAMFAGLAVVEAVPAAPCSSPVPLPTVLVASSGDPLLTVPAQGKPKVIQGWVEPTVTATVAEYQRIDGCVGPGAVMSEGNLTTTTWAACQRGARLQYDLYHGGTHRWPKGGPTTPSAQATIAAFLLHPSTAR